MKNFISYLRFLMKAKGRHGTHSPFVYGFVEAVMRDKRQFYAFGTLQQKSLLSPTSYSTNKKIFRIIQFLSPSAVWLSAGAAPLAEIVAAARPGGSLPPAAPVPAGAMIIASIAEIDETVLTKWSAQSAGQFFVLVIDPHANPGLWDKACSHPAVTMSLDLWQLGLLCSGDAFKVKQHFNVR